MYYTIHIKFIFFATGIFMILAAATVASTYSRLSAEKISADMQSEPTQKITVSRKISAITGRQENPDKVTLSDDGLRRSRDEQSKTAEATPSQSLHQINEKKSSSPELLSTEKQQAVQKLKIRDAEVKAHEQAHLANAGRYAAGGPSYTYQTGPDGRRYAVGGEVPIDVSKEKTPEQTIQKMRIVRRAALAPAHPSSADQSIAAAASMKESQAVREVNSKQSTVEPAELQDAPADTSAESASENKSKAVRRQDFQALYV
jgi:hypothetical protein